MPRRPTGATAPGYRTAGTPAKSKRSKPIGSIKRGVKPPRRVKYPSASYKKLADSEMQLRPKKRNIISTWMNKEMNKKEALDFFDPTKHTNTCISTPNSLGSYLCLMSQQRINQSLSTTNAGTDYFYIYTWTPTNLCAFRLSTVGTQYLIPILASDWSSVPETVRPSRLCLELQNISNNQVADGSVSVLSVPNPLQYEYDAWVLNDPYVRASANFISSLRTMTDSHPKVKNYSHNDLRNLRRFVSSPSSYVGFTRWMEYLDYNQGVTLGQPITSAQRDNMVSILNDSVEHQAMNTIIIRLRLTSTTNAFEFVVKNQIAARYPSNNLLGRIETQKEPNITEAGLNKRVAAANEVPGGDPNTMGAAGLNVPTG